MPSIMTDISPDTVALAEALSATPVGETITYETLSAAIGRDVREHAVHLLHSAFRIVQRDHGAVFSNIRLRGTGFRFRYPTLDQGLQQLFAGQRGRDVRQVRADLGAAVPSGASVARPADLAVVLFTSGSTSTPKAVLHTQRGLAYKGQLMCEVHGLTADDARFLDMPFYRTGRVRKDPIGEEDVRIVEALYESATTEKPANLPPYEEASHPTKQRGMRRPPAYPRNHRAGSLRCWTSRTPAWVTRTRSSISREKGSERR